MKSTKPNLPKQTNQTKSVKTDLAKPTKPNLPNHADQTKLTKPNLNYQIFQNKRIKAILAIPNRVSVNQSKQRSNQSPKSLSLP